MMENIMQFLKALKTDPRAAELVKGRATPRNDQEAIASYAELAQALGCSLSKEEITEALSAMVRERKEKTAKTESEIGKLVIHEEALDQVAGGAIDFMPDGSPERADKKACSATYDSGDWCWWTDMCDNLIDLY